MEINYAEGKRPLKIDVFVIDSPDAEEYLSHVINFVVRNANAPEHIAKMEPAKYWPLVERLSTLFCRSYSPTTNWGVKKPAIRGAIHFVLHAGVQAGFWPDRYRTTDETSVQYGGSRYE